MPQSGYGFIITADHIRRIKANHRWQPSRGFMDKWQNHIAHNPTASITINPTFDSG